MKTHKKKTNKERSEEDWEQFSFRGVEIKRRGDKVWRIWKAKGRSGSKERADAIIA